MSTAANARWRLIVRSSAAILPALLLAACSGGRDTDMSEKLAAAEAAAQRAEAAQKAAEKAARAAGASIQSLPDAVEEDPDRENADEEGPAREDPDSGAFDNTIVTPQPQGAGPT